MNILFYTPLNCRSRDIESQALAFGEKSHACFLLTQGSTGVLHSYFRGYGFVAEADMASARTSLLRTLRRLISLVLFCRKNRIDVVYAHLEPCNFISAMARYFVNARVIVCRHHVDEARLYGFGKDFSYRLTYALAKEIVVVSERARQYMIAKENIPAKKIHMLQLGYDFALYPAVDRERSCVIRQQHDADVLLLTVCRLTRHKRPEASIELAGRLLQKGLHVKLIILGQGELYAELGRTLQKSGLQERVFMKGWVPNVLDYMGAADLLCHPSMLDSSSITLKEAALASLPMIACREVGDFESVLADERGFLVNADSFIEEAENIILRYTGHKAKLKETGDNCKKFVLAHFDIRQVAPHYERLFHQRSAR